MTNEIGDINYRSLVYFYENKIKIHFKDMENIFYNGLILSLDKKTNTIILKERVKGIIPITLEKIKSDSICKFTEVGE